MKGEFHSLARERYASNGNISGQGSCSKVVCDVTSGGNVTVTPQVDSGRIIYGTTYKAVCDTGHVFSDGSESFPFQCGGAGSAIEVPECNPVTCDVFVMTNVENISVQNCSFGLPLTVICKDGYHHEQESFDFIGFENQSFVVCSAWCHTTWQCGEQLRYSDRECHGQHRRIEHVDLGNGLCTILCTLYPGDTASCVSAHTVHGCTVAFGSGWEGGTC